MKRDPYEVLGVPPDSGPADWKRAFRRLAMRWHPDRSDHPEATERFKEINAAYEALSTENPEKGQKSESDAADESPETPADSSADMENDRADDADDANTAAGAPKAADIRLNLELTVEEGAAGCRKSVAFYRGKPCPTCDGSGEAGLARTRFCQDCHGSGRVRDAERVLIKCTACGGRGLFTERICPDCGGSGRDSAEVHLEITVPPGMLPGDELRLAGQGEAAYDDVAAGDLYLTIVLRSHALYRLDGRDLHYAMPVSALAMMAGGEIELPSPQGLLRHVLEAGPATVRRDRLPGRGYPGRGKNRAGDLVVELSPVFPSQLSAKQRKLLLQANAALFDDLPNALPEIAAWRDAHGL